MLTTAAADVQQAVGILDGWLSAHPDEPLAPVMWQYLGDIHFFYRNDDGAALDAYLAADRLGVLWASREGQLWWRMAVLAERLKRTEVAIAFYRKICTDAQTSGRAFEAQLALARLGVEPPELTAFASYEGPRPDFSDAAAPIVAPAPPAPSGAP
ncbi:MAG: hypothetical protein H0W72_04340 [Planctomycetes bacterium]|nr:hypothetical protein [Planctomycetota bacterium]